MIANVPRRPVLLVILDGYGINPEPLNNGVALARKPHLDAYFQRYLLTRLEASGRSVGLPEGQMGNSEVGHLALGSGTILRQDLVRIDDSIRDRSFFNNPSLIAAVEHAKKRQRPLHLVGLVSDGGVHSHIEHLYALIDLCAHHGVVPALHMITDGRDTPPKHALTYLPALEYRLAEAKGSIATVIGRYYAMDRDKRWERTKRAWAAMVFRDGVSAPTARDAIERAYDAQITDEFIEPTVIGNAATIQSNDSVIFFNFRNDRARQLTYVLAGEDFKPFDRAPFQPVNVTCLTEYDSLLPLPVAFTAEHVEKTLASLLSARQIAQFHCAETEKYAHVTFFFNGGREKPHTLEDRIMIPSPKVATYDLAPEMNASHVADEVIKALRLHQYGFLVVNFANGDMVGHTAVRDAVIRAVETLDREVGRVLDAAIRTGYSVILTADHGNCELLVDPVTGAPHTQHTTFPVPCMVIDRDNWQIAATGGISQIAPTVLQLMGIEQPPEMTAASLLTPR